MKAKMKFLSAVMCLTCLGGAITMASCDAKPTPTNSSQNSETTLNTAENQIYEGLAYNLTSFDAPNSVILLRVWGYAENSSVYLQINFENINGGHLSSWFMLWLSESRKNELGPGYLPEVPINDDEGIDVGKINRKLTEYKNSKGWL